MKRIFLDSEFSGLTLKAKLLSIALVAETGETFYGVFNDCEPEIISGFAAEHVLPYLDSGCDCGEMTGRRITGSSLDIRRALEEWLGQFDGILQVWGDVPHYDWVLFCELFGGALHIPANVHYICRDLATLLSLKGYDADMDRSALLDSVEMPADFKRHHALSDAETGMRVLKKLSDGNTDL
jgi:hypothetical protein